MNVFMLDALLACQATRTGHAASTVSAGCLGIQHHGEIHSWQLPGEPYGLQITKLPPISQQGCGNGRGLLGRVLASSTLKE